MQQPSATAITDTSGWQLLVVVLVALALSVAPFSFGFGVHAAQTNAHAVAGVQHGHDEGLPADVGGALDHIVSHCGAQLCAPSYIDARAANALPPSAWAQVPVRADGGRALRPLYLDSDPPVPRPALS